MPPTEFPSPTAPSTPDDHPVEYVPTVYAAYAAGQPMPSVQPHLDFRALLQRAGDVVERNREARASEGDTIGVSDWSSSPKRVSDEAEKTLKALHMRGWHAMTLFEIVLMYFLWFQAAASAAPADEAQGPAPRPAPRPGADAAPGVGSGADRGGADDAPPLRDLTELSRSEFLVISGHLMDVLGVAIGSTNRNTGLATMTLPGFLTDDILFESQPEESHPEEGAVDTAPTRVSRDIEDVVELYHLVRCRSLSFIQSLW